MDNDRGAVSALQLPAFELDCRDWLVATPDDGSVPDEIGGAPLVAILSTVFVAATTASTDDRRDRGPQGLDFQPASAVFSVGLADDTASTHCAGADAGIARLIDFDLDAGAARYVVPTPDSGLALLAEFACGRGGEPELMWRFHRLMNSFRWAS